MAKPAPKKSAPAKKEAAKAAPLPPRRRRPSRRRGRTSRRRCRPRAPPRRRPRRPPSPRRPNRPSARARRRSTPSSSTASASCCSRSGPSCSARPSALEGEAASLMEDLDPGDVQFDDESGEGDSLVVERERDLALSAQARQTIADIDAALERIAEGTYGFSVVSGQRHPEGAPAGHPVGDRAGRGEGRRPRHSAVSAPPRPVTPTGRRGARPSSVDGRRWPSSSSISSRRRGRSTPSTTDDIDVVWTLRFHLTFNGGMAFSQGRGLGPDHRRPRHRGGGRAARLAAARPAPRSPRSPSASSSAAPPATSSTGCSARATGFLGGGSSTSSTCSGGRSSTWPTRPW